MKLAMLARLIFHPSWAAVALILSGATASAVQAQGDAQAGLVMAVDAGKKTLLLETRAGLKHVPVAAAATIRGDHGEPLELGDLNPGDAVTYTTGSEAAASLRVARQFWAVPTER